IKPVLDIDKQRASLDVLKQQSTAPDLWDNQEQAVQLLADLAATEKLLTSWSDVEALISMGEELGEEEVQLIDQEIRALEQRALLSGDHDKDGAIFAMHAGTGGADAEGWAEILERLLLRYVEEGKTEAAESRTLGLDRCTEP